VCRGIGVVAVDIGSVGPSSKFAWAAFDAPQRQVMAAGTDPQTAVWALAPGLLSGARAALVLEAPMSVPVPDGQLAAGTGRETTDRSESTRAGQRRYGGELAAQAWPVVPGRFTGGFLLPGVERGGECEVLGGSRARVVGDLQAAARLFRRYGHGAQAAGQDQPAVEGLIEPVPEPRHAPGGGPPQAPLVNNSGFGASMPRA
jgi:hypothetical protein